MKKESEEVQEDKMSLFALRSGLDEAIERIKRLEMATIYKVGFWSFLTKYILGFLGIFKYWGF